MQWFHVAMQQHDHFTARSQILPYIGGILASIGSRQQDLFVSVSSMLLEYCLQYFTICLQRFRLPHRFVEACYNTGDTTLMVQILQYRINRFMPSLNSNHSNARVMPWFLDNPLWQKIISTLENARNVHHDSNVKYAVLDTVDVIKRTNALLHAPSTIRTLSDYPDIFILLDGMIESDTYLKWYDNNDAGSIALWEILIKKQFAFALVGGNNTLIANDALQKHTYYKLWCDTLHKGHVLMSLESYALLAQVFIEKYNDPEQFMYVYSWVSNQLHQRDWTHCSVYNCFLLISDVYTHAVINHNVTGQHVRDIWEMMKLHGIDRRLLEHNCNVMMNQYYVSQMYGHVFDKVLSISMDTNDTQIIQEIILSKYFMSQVKSLILVRNFAVGNERSNYFYDRIEELRVAIVYNVQVVNYALMRPWIFTGGTYMKQLQLQKLQEVTLIPLLQSAMQLLKLDGISLIDTLVLEMERLVIHLEKLDFVKSFDIWEIVVDIKTLLTMRERG
eukprot:1013227_1